MVDLLLLNLLTPRITFYFSPFLSLSFTPVRSTLGRTEVGSRVKNRCRKNRDDGLAEGERRTGWAGQRLTENDERAEKTNCGSRGKRIICADDLYSPTVSNRFATERDTQTEESVELIPFSEAVIGRDPSCVAHRFNLRLLIS